MIKYVLILLWFDVEHLSAGVRVMKLASILMLSLFSLNTLSTELSPAQKNLIQRGYECCYSQEVIDEVQQPVYNYQPAKIDLDLPPIKEPASKLSWLMFIGLQLLDVYTTNNILKYNCVKELNPILGKKPNLSKLIAIKLVILTPFLYTMNKYYIITDDDLAVPNYLMTVVVANNFDVWSKAKSKCNLL